MTLETFYERHLGREFLISRVDCALPGWPELNRALERATIEDRARFAFSREKSVDGDADDIWLRNGDLAIHKVRKRINDGYTFIFNNFHLHCEAFRAIERDVRARFLEPLNVNCYVSVRPTIGFGPHWDDHDVFAVQLEGRKYWALYGFTDPDPLDRDRCTPLPAGGGPVWEGFLEKGECLYIPRGLWHSAVSTGAPSMHAACGVRGATGVDVLHWLAACARDHPELRASLHPHPEHQTASQRICEFLASQATADLVERFVRDRAMQAEPPQIAGFPDSLGLSDEDLRGAHIRYCGPRDPVTWSMGDKTALVIAGVEFALSAECMIAFRHLPAHDGSRFAALCESAPGAPRTDIAAMVRALEAAGCAVIDRRGLASAKLP